MQLTANKNGYDGASLVDSRDEAVVQSRPIAPGGGGEGISRLDNWNSCVEDLSDSTCRINELWRGYSPGFFHELRNRKLAGEVDGAVAFPAPDRDGVIRSAYLDRKGSWSRIPVGEPSIHDSGPYSIGHSCRAGEIIIFRCHWDMLAMVDKLGWPSLEPASPRSVAYLATSLAGPETNFEGRCPPGAKVYAVTQNDPPADDEQPGIGGEWLANISRQVGRPVLVVRPPVQFRTFNDWTRSRPGADEIRAAIAAATPFSPATPPPQRNQSPRKRKTPKPVTVEIVEPSEPPEPEARSFNLDPGPFPIDALNPIIRNRVEETARARGVEIQLPAMAALATLGGVVSNLWQVNNAVPGYRTNGNLFVFVAAPSGYGKGSAQELARPILDASDELADRFVRVDKPRLMAQQIELNAMLARAKQQLRWCSPEEQARVIEVLGKLLGEQEMTAQRLEEPSLWTGEATPAALARILQRNGGRAFLYSLEAGNALRIPLGKFSRGGDFDLLLSGYSGEPFGKSRICGGDTKIRACVSILWLGRPKLMNELLENVEARERGLVARFLGCVVRQERLDEEEELEPACNPIVAARYNELVGAIIREGQGRNDPVTIECLPEARNVYRQFNREAMALRRNAPETLESLTGRFREQAIRVGNGLWVADYFAAGQPDGPFVLAPEQAERSCRIARWACLSMAGLVHNEHLRGQSAEAAKLRKLIEDQGGEITLRDLERRHNIDRATAEAFARDFPESFALETIQACKDGHRRGRRSDVMRLAD
jgi:hypothetical protein